MVFSLVLWDLIISLICSTSIAMNIDGGAIKILNHGLLRYIAFGLAVHSVLKQILCGHLYTPAPWLLWTSVVRFTLVHN